MNETGDGTWLDMSRYPDVDPDTAIPAGDLGMLRATLALDHDLPAAVWDRMLELVLVDDVATQPGEPGVLDGGVDEAWSLPADDTGWPGETVPWTDDTPAADHTPWCDTHPVPDDPGHPVDDPAG